MKDLKGQKKNNANKEENYQKSNKISNMAKMLENQIGMKTQVEEGQTNSLNIQRVEDQKNTNNNDFNNEIIDLIDHKPVVEKKKKKKNNFSFDG